MINGKRPDLSLEIERKRQGFYKVAGVDEVGRGPLAGPVVAAAVHFNSDRLPMGLNDSKKLSEKKRNELFYQIMITADVGLAALPAVSIDRLNIREASLTAMLKAVAALRTQPDHLLIDGRDIPKACTIPATAVIKGDTISASIAAASIIAKVTRDRMMRASAHHYPEYGFDIHKGYGTKQHRDAITRNQPCDLHRYSFKSIRNAE